MTNMKCYYYKLVVIRGTNGEEIEFNGLSRR